jgi:hypothetical protein
MTVVPSLSNHSKVKPAVLPEPVATPSTITWSTVATPFLGLQFVAGVISMSAFAIPITGGSFMIAFDEVTVQPIPGTTLSVTRYVYVPPERFSAIIPLVPATLPTVVPRGVIVPFPSNHSIV